MTDEQYAYIKSNRKRKLTWTEYTDYVILIVPIYFILMPIAIVILGFKQVILNYMFCAGLIVEFILGIIFFRLMLLRLKQNISFVSVATPFKLNENLELSTRVIESFGCHFTKFSNCIIANKKMSFFSWGEEITIIPLDYEILVNSRPSRQPITFYADVANVKRFQEQINEKVIAFAST